MHSQSLEGAISNKGVKIILKSDLFFPTRCFLEMILISHIPVDNKLEFIKYPVKSYVKEKSQIRFHKGFGHIKNAIS